MIYFEILSESSLKCETVSYKNQIIGNRKCNAVITVTQRTNKSLFRDKTV